VSPEHRELLLNTVEVKTRQLCAPASTREYALLEELSFVRREAQAEADQAYDDWLLLASGDAYAVYRAAQDRADAAQDDLANLVAQLAA
jgi:hypothetical protein